jgi:hypothetical protein
VKIMMRLVMLCASCFPFVCHASGGVASGTVAHIFVTATFGDIIYVELSGAKTGNPACSTRSPWQFAIPRGSKAVNGLTPGDLVALVFEAQKKGNSITIGGSGVCDIDASEESISFVQD